MQYISSFLLDPLQFFHNHHLMSIKDFTSNDQRIPCRIDENYDRSGKREPVQYIYTVLEVLGRMRTFG